MSKHPTDLDLIDMLNERLDRAAGIAGAAFCAVGHIGAELHETNVMEAIWACKVEIEEAHQQAKEWWNGKKKEGQA